MKPKLNLTAKLLIAIVTLSVALIGATILIGFIRYEESIRKVYNDTGYVIGNIILDNIDRDKVAQYADTYEKDDYYDVMDQYLDNVLSASNAAYIYIMVPHDDGTMTYIYDCTDLELGDSEPMSSYVNELNHAYKTGERINDYMVRRSQKYGYLTSSVLPIKGSDGKVSALLCVDVHMEIIVSTIRSYAITVILASLALLIVFTLLYLLYMKMCILKPISIMTSESHNFATNSEDEMKISGLLDTIKTNDELQDLAQSISKMENDIVNYIKNIRVVTTEKERIGAELNVAKTIQADMLPSIFPPFPEHPEFEIYATMDPAKEVGGDFYDFFMIDESHLGVVMADVSGKGVPAALFMVISKTLIKNTAMNNTFSPKEVLEKVNNQLCENNAAEMFVTTFFGVLDIDTGVMHSANAGHEYPAVRTASGTYLLLKDPHGFVLAGMPGVKYTEFEFTIQPGGALFLYTDGVPEATSADKELYGTDRMLAALNKVRHLPIKDTLAAVRKDIDDFVGDAEQFDDITMLVVRYKADY